VIPDEAVEAAARALWSPSNEGDTWESEHEPYKDHTRAEAKRALEAAAPHLRAVAFEDAADRIMGPSDVPLDAATCRWNAMELRETAAHLRTPDA